LPASWSRHVRLDWRIFSIGAEVVTSVATSSSPISLPHCVEERFGGAARSCRNIVGGEGIEFLVLHHVVAHQRLADRVDHHRARDVDVEGVAVAILAAQRIERAPICMNSRLLRSATCMMVTRGRVDFASAPPRRLVQHALGLGRGGRGYESSEVMSSWRPSRPGLVDFLSASECRLGVSAERAEKTVNASNGQF